MIRDISSVLEEPLTCQRRHISRPPKTILLFKTPGRNLQPTPKRQTTTLFNGENGSLTQSAFFIPFVDFVHCVAFNNMTIGSRLCFLLQAKKHLTYVPLKPFLA